MRSRAPGRCARGDGCPYLAPRARVQSSPAQSRPLRSTSRPSRVRGVGDGARVFDAADDAPVGKRDRARPGLAERHDDRGPAVRCSGPAPPPAPAKPRRRDRAAGVRPSAHRASRASSPQIRTTVRRPRTLRRRRRCAAPTVYARSRGLRRSAVPAVVATRDGPASSTRSSVAAATIVLQSLSDASHGVTAPGPTRAAVMERRLSRCVGSVRAASSASSIRELRVRVTHGERARDELAAPRGPRLIARLAALRERERA